MSRRLKTEVGTYRVLPEANGNGTYFFTDCGHKMYSIKSETAYHGCLCPGCMYHGVQRTLYIRGSDEANNYWDDKLNNQ